jgi:hypothetical protein
MRFWLCLIVTACGASSEPPAVSSPAPPALLPAPSVALPAPSTAVPPPLTAAHGGDIVALGATPDGVAVVSADQLGGIRLWATLDGTREPVVIQGIAPRSVTLAPDGDGFVIGTLDAAGGVQLIRTSAAGALRGRVSLASGQPATEIDSTPEGLLILHADQALELVDTTGTVRAHLTPEPGTHIESILVRGRHALALVREDKHLHGRRIVLDHGARWGEATPKLAVPIEHAVLSPDGDLLAANRPRNLHPVLIDLATGAARKTPLCVAKDWPHEGGEGVDESPFLAGDNAPVPLGFLGNTTVACSVGGALVWWNTDGTPEPNVVGTFATSGAVSCASDRALVVGMGGSLAIGTPTQNQYLGYGLHDITRLRAAPGGVLISGSDQQSLVLDAGLRERARLEVGRARVDWSDVVALDDRYAITASIRRGPDRKESVQIAVFDGLTRRQHQLLPYEGRDHELAYEPATRLLAIDDDVVSVLVQLDPVSHTFGAPIRLASATAPGKLVVLDPTLADGVAALQIHTTGDGLLVGELHAVDLVPGAVVRPRTMYKVPGELRAVDRAGRLYLHAPADHDDVMVYVHGTAGTRLPGMAGLTLRPSPDGARVAAFLAPRIVLLTGAGEVRWDAAQWDITDLAWTSAGDLVVQFPAGIARLDLQTGALADRRCGWSFGLSEQPIEVGRSSPSICDMDRDR